MAHAVIDPNAAQEEAMTMEILIRIGLQQELDQDDFSIFHGDFSIFHDDFSIFHDDLLKGV